VVFIITLPLWRDPLLPGVKPTLLPGREKFYGYTPDNKRSKGVTAAPLPPDTGA